LEYQETVVEQYQFSWGTLYCETIYLIPEFGAKFQNKCYFRNWNQALLRRPNPAILTAEVGRWNSAARIEQQIPSRCFDRNTLNPDSTVGPFHRILHGRFVNIKIYRWGLDPARPTELERRATGLMLDILLKLRLLARGRGNKESARRTKV
jgi:hypothetical protein